MKRPILLLLPLLLALGSGQELLVNGDFEQPLSTGWSQTQSGSGTHTVDRATTYHPDPDYEAQCYQYDGAGWTRLAQMIDVPSTALELSFWAKFEIGGGSSTCWPVAAVFVEYCDADGALLGETRIYHHNAYCNWTNTGTRHLIDVTNPDWLEYTLNVEEEIANNLPGVQPGMVRKIQVSLYDYTSGG